MKGSRKGMRRKNGGAGDEREGFMCEMSVYNEHHRINFLNEYIDCMNNLTLKIPDSSFFLCV